MGGQCDFFETHHHFGPRGFNFGPGFGSFGSRFGCGPSSCRFGGPDHRGDDNRGDDHSRCHHGFDLHFGARGFGPRGFGHHRGARGRGHHSRHDGPFGFLLHSFGPRGFGPWSRPAPYDRHGSPCCRHNRRSCDAEDQDPYCRSRNFCNCEESGCDRPEESDRCENCCKKCSKENQQCCSKNKDNKRKGPQLVTGEVFSGEGEERTSGEAGEAGDSAPEKRTVAE